jgi:hypothetical protein
MQVSRSAYYQYLTPQHCNVDKQQVEEKVTAVFKAHKRRYGICRICAELKEQQIRVGKHKCRRIMKEHGLCAIQPRSFVPRTTQSRHPYPLSPNLLLAREAPAKPDEVWVGDTPTCRFPKEDGRIFRYGWTCTQEGLSAGSWNLTCGKG